MRSAWLLMLVACGSEQGGPYFDNAMFFDHDVSSAPKAADSDQIIGALRAAGGWGNSDRFAIDFSFDVLAGDGAPMRTFSPNADFYTPDCDAAPVPVPDGGNVEGEAGYACTQGGDCHLLVFDKSAGKLYEMYRADIEGSAFSGGCLAVWNTHEAYGDKLRGDQCTSADAAGLPIAPLLFTADEVAAGHIDHAIRFTLPNDRIRQGFVRPATHASSTNGLAGAPYYGVHLRLRADYPIDSLPSEGARVVARALQTYGMFHADGGDIVLTAQSDRRSQTSWSGLLGAQDLQALAVEDFEVIDHGPMITLTNDCMR
jgi:serine/threonine-protein kinase